MQQICISNKVAINNLNITHSALQLILLKFECFGNLQAATPSEGIIKYYAIISLMTNDTNKSGTLYYYSVC